MPEQGLTRTEQEILDYLRNNPGSSKADVVRHLRDKQVASKMTVFQYLKDLENKNMIYGKKERPNSQSFMMYVNEENKLASVLAELEEFEISYLNLLEKFRDIINNKDYSEAAKELGLTEIDPAKWSEKDKKSYIYYEGNIIRELSYKLKENIAQLREIQTTFKNKTFSKDKVIRFQELMNSYNEIILPFRKVTSLFLTEVATDLFLVLLHIILFRSVFVWPSKPDIDKETLSMLYSVIYNRVAKIQLELSSFLKSINTGYHSQIDIDPSTFLIRSMFRTGIGTGTNVGTVPSILVGIVLANPELFPIKNEVESVINALDKLHEEIKQYKFYDFKTILEGSDTQKKIIELLESMDEYYDKDSNSKKEG
jgi:DNA-binding MarR family transcriptional regulator